MASPRSPFVTRFLSDFTLGFSDGLTVPFALSAGLSSLGRTQTVIHAGFAELCAGSVSMGIGGYLSALDDATAAQQRKQLTEEGEIDERRGILSDSLELDAASEKDIDCCESLVRHHLEPLNLPPELVSDVMAAVGQSQQGLHRAALQIRSLGHNADSPADDPFVVHPWVSGLSISIGYVIGGLIPLLPYCIASTIGAALRWSIGLCLVAMFVFGFGKNWALSMEKGSWSQSSWEGLRMLLLGSFAAATAVACIRLVEGIGDGNS